MPRVLSLRDNLPRLVHRLDVMRRSEKKDRAKTSTLFMMKKGWGGEQDAAIAYWTITAVLLLIAECVPSVESYVNAALAGDKTLALAQARADRRQSKRERKRLEKEAKGQRRAA